MEFQIQEVADYLDSWDRRRRRNESIKWGAKGLLAGLLLGVVIATISRVEPTLTSRELISSVAVLSAAGIFSGIIFAWLPRRSIITKARFADRQFNTQERLSAAIEINEGELKTDPQMAEDQLEDTLESARAVDVSRQMPLSLGRRELYLIILAAILLAAAVILDNPMARELERRRELDKVIQDQITQLESLAEEISGNEELGLEAVEELTAPIEEALEQLNEGDIGREELYAALSEAEADFKELSSRRDTGDLMERLGEAGDSFADGEYSQELGEALNNGDLSSAGAALSQMADNLSGLGSEDLASLAQSLSEAAEALRASDSQLAGELAEAASALEAGDVAEAQQNLREAAATMQQRNQERAAAAQASEAAGQLAESRGAVAEAGQADQPGESGSSETSAQGSESGTAGQGSGSGQGSGLSQSGPSSGGQAASGSNGGAAGLQQGGGTGGPGPGGGHSENVYAPEFVDLSAESGINVELPAECQANPADCGILINESPTEFRDEESLIPYEQVFGDYRRAAYQALEEEYVPLGLREYVKDYFTSLEP